MIRMRNIWPVICLSAILALLLVFSSWGGWLSAFDDLAFQLNFRVRGGLPLGKPSIVVVDIDEKSISAEGRWPWPRAKLAKLVEIVNKADAKAIGVNIIFVQSDDLNDDERLLDALTRRQSIVVGDLLERKLVPIWAGSNRKYRSNLKVGYIDVARSRFGEVIGVPLREPLDPARPENIPFSVEIARSAGAPANIFAPFTGEIVKSNFYGPAKTFARLSATDILNGVGHDSLSGNIVLIGADLPPIAEALSPFGQMGLSEIQANIIQSFVDDNYFRGNFVSDFLILVIAVLASYYLFLRQRLIWIIVVVVVYIVANHILFRFGYLIPASGALLAVVISWLLIHTRNTASKM